MHFQVTAPVFAEFVTQVQVYDKVVAGVPIAVAAETGGQQDVVGPVFVFVTQGGLHLMTGYQACIGRIFVTPVGFGIGIGVGEGGIIFGTEDIGDGQVQSLLVLSFIIVRTPPVGCRIVMPENWILCVA